MEGDLTQKVRESIKEKLKELKVYADDDLPEYIMVMVANKKSQESMEGDLSLFLKKQAPSFTHWLHDMLDKLEKETSKRLASADAGTINNSARLEVEDIPKNLDEDEVLTLDAQLQVDQMLLKELHENTPKEDSKEKAKTTSSSDYKAYRRRPAPIDSLGDRKSVKSVLKPRSTVTRAIKRTAAVLSDDDEYDPLNPGVKSVASIIQCKQRKSSFPPSLQANSTLLLKAMEAANRSIISQKQQQKISELYKPTPIDILNRPLRKSVSELTYGPYEIPVKSEFIANDSELIDEQYPNEMENNLKILTSTALEAYIPQPYNCNAHLESFINPNEEYEDSEMDVQSLEEIVEQPEARVSPNFVVTLNGIDSSIYDDALDYEEMDNTDVENSVVTSLSLETEEEDKELMTEKSTEKCHFWPACKNGDDCTFYHPSVKCKMFPNCVFGEKCRFIHPQCKYDATCSRSDCHFLHTVKRDFSQGSTGFTIGMVPKIPTSPKPVITKTPICKFFPNCSSYKCPYLHPKKCRFGGDCKVLGCPFAHPSFPSRHQLTWVA